MNSYHTPVLLKESISGLNIKPDGIYLDVTYGGGGHARAILSLLERGRLIAFDQDEASQQSRIDDDRLTLLLQNFRYLKNNLKYLGITQVDGILADLGVSSYQFDNYRRGFTYRVDTELDMRMNRKKRLSAREVLNRYSAKELTRVFQQYAEIRHPDRLVSLIIKAREKREIKTTGDLVNVLKLILKGGRYNKFLSRIFQALRIEVNEEIESLGEMLKQTPEVIRKGGRLVVISYHSLEDRMVKHFMKTGSFLPGTPEESIYGRKTSFRMVNRRVIIPGPEEIAANPRSRSAKLRIAELI